VSVVRDIVVYYDIKKALGPYLNTKIHYYNLPLNFRMKPSYGRTAITQYRNLSTNPHWLPPEPALKTKDNEVIRNAMSQLTQSIIVPELAVVNGRSELSSFFGLGTASSGYGEQHTSSVIAPKPAHDVLSNRKQVEALNDLSELLPSFQALSMDSVLQQEIRMMDESDGIDVKRAYALRKETQKLMIESSNAKEGFIIWLDLAKQKTLPSIHQLSPIPFDPKLSLEKIDELELDCLDEAPTTTEEVDLSKDAAKKRKKKADNESKDADSFNKQVKAANEIASSCRWVLEQLASSRISEAPSVIFDESHFHAVQLTTNEINWLKAHDSVEKVLHLTCLAYAAAPKWEPYPQTILSVQDLEKIEAERSAQERQ